MSWISSNCQGDPLDLPLLLRTSRRYGLVRSAAYRDENGDIDMSTLRSIAEER